MSIENEELVGKIVRDIPVHISYEIIHLFSEGLYKSPHKAVEELVSNSYDAGATEVHVLLPREADDDSKLDPLWVIDNGEGMNTHGFIQLWRVADSPKALASTANTDRLPIGQFGIGKLASYVLARKLTHISCTDKRYHYTTMDFKTLKDHHQFETLDPVKISLYELSEEQSKRLLSDIQTRNPEAWKIMFGTGASPSWTAAGLSEFKSLYKKLKAGRLRWVLSTGLPLQSDFKLWLNNEKLISSKVSTKKAIATYDIGYNEDNVIKIDGVTINKQGISIDGITGNITGSATIYEKQLSEGKSDQLHRSHGFFIRVRGRMINLEDELFGLPALNHATWSRFSMTIHADGLRDHLLSSREGVRESEPVRILRRYLHEVFNHCRRAYERWDEKEKEGDDIKNLLRDAPSKDVIEPIVETVRNNLDRDRESFYITYPQLQSDDDKIEWLEEFRQEILNDPFKEVEFKNTGPYDRALHYKPNTQSLIMNVDHPFIDKLVSDAKNKAPAKLFGLSEVLTEALMHQHGFTVTSILDLLDNRDRILRLIAGDQIKTAKEVLRLLNLANQNTQALERATGVAFRALGFEYERRGGYTSGPDGILFARLGRGEDYRIVYDAKQTDQPPVPADKIDISNIEIFRQTERADYAFFIADSYAGEDNKFSRANQKVKGQDKITLLRVSDIRKLVELHYQYGVTLTSIRELFDSVHTVPEVREWITEFEKKLMDTELRVPIRLLLDELQKAKEDQKATPNIKAVRAVVEKLKDFEPERLMATLQAVETIVGERWIEVDSDGDVRLNNTPDLIVTEFEKQLGSVLSNED